MKFPISRRAAVVVAPLAGILLAIGVAGTAGAATAPAGKDAISPQATITTYVDTDGVNIRSGPGTEYSSNGQAQEGQPLRDTCYYYEPSHEVDGNPFWDRVTDESTGVSGYVTEYYLTNQTQSTPC
jgi:uncharacterized protein YgiM (DUF1202 family)